MQPAYLLASSQDTQFWTSFEGQRQVPVCSFLLLEDAFLLPHVPVEGKYSPIPVLQTPLKMKNILRIGIFKVAHKQYQQRQEQYNEVKFLQKLTFLFERSTIFRVLSLSFSFSLSAKASRSLIS